MTTLDMESALIKRLQGIGIYICLEVKMPTNYEDKENRVKRRERVDCITYNKSKEEWRFYELKLTKSDFHSKCAHSFYGHLNYYVVPEELYDKIKEEVPPHVGVYVIKEERSGCEAVSVKRAKRQELYFKHEELMWAFTQASARDANHWYKTKGGK